MTFSLLPNLFKSRNDRDHLFEDFSDFYHQFRKTGCFVPKLDVSESDSEYYVELDLPGLTKEDIDIKVDNNILTIRGKKEVKKEVDDRNFHMRERAYGEFNRSLTLPSNTKLDSIDASFKDGVLQIKLDKKETDTSKKIEVK